MPRLNPINPETADPKSNELIADVQKKIGMTPNMFATLAQSPAAFQSYLTFGETLKGGVLSAKLGEQIALAVAGANACQYCASAHTAIGGSLGVDQDELARNLDGESSDAKTATALEFARNVVAKRGWVSDADLAEVRNAGFTEGEVAEIVAHVALNTFTNYFNHVAQPEVDFPKVEVGEVLVA